MAKRKAAIRKKKPETVACGTLCEGSGLVKSLHGLDSQIQEAKILLKKVEAKAVRLREAIVTFEAEKKATLEHAASTHN